MRPFFHEEGDAYDQQLRRNCQQDLLHLFTLLYRLRISLHGYGRIRYKRNGYIMGAGTITGNLVEKQVGVGFAQSVEQPTSKELELIG